MTFSAEDLKRLRSMGNRLAEEAADEIEALRLDAERWRAMRELLVAVDWQYGEPPISIAAFELKTDVVMYGPDGADAIADAAMKDKP